MKLPFAKILIPLLIAPLLLSADTQSVTFEGESATLSGAVPKVGEMAPLARATNKDFSRITIGGANEKVQIIATVPSLDTPVCSREIHNFDSAVKELEHVHMTVVSMDLPFGGQRYCRGYKIENITVSSDFAFHDVSEKYGVKIASGKLQGLLARTIFVVNTKGEIVYREVVPHIEDEPDYDKIIEIAKTTK